MLKLRKLIKEHTWDREFGDPLVTFEDVMEKHQENKFKEDLDSVDKEDDDVDNDGDSDASDDYLKNRRDVISKAIEKESIKENWWDDMDSASQAAYIKKHPGSQQAQQADADDSEGDFPKDPDDIDDLPDDEDDYDMGGDDRVPNQDFRSDPTDDDYSVYDDPELARIPDEDDEESSGRTGKELNQETLMIDGKQYNRISEMTSKTKRDMENSFDSAEDLDDFITKHQSGIPKNQWRKMDNYLDDIRDEEEGMKPSGWADPAKKGLKKILTRYIKESAKPNNRISEGKINSKFIKYRIYDKIADEINKVELDDFNLRNFNPLKSKIISFVEREVKKEKKMGNLSVLKQAFKKSDFEDKVFGRGGIIDGWYKKSKRDFPKFMKKYPTYSDNPKKGWKNYNASSLTYGIGKPLYKIVDSLLDGINSLVPESKYPFSEFYQRFKRQEN